MGPEERHGQVQPEFLVGVSGFDSIFRTCSFDFSVLLTPAFSPPLSSYRATSKGPVRLAPTKALKIGASATPHSAPQPPTEGDQTLETEAVKLREAMALEAQLAQ
jgi:hypothetical protein